MGRRGRLKVEGKEEESSWGGWGGGTSNIIKKNWRKKCGRQWQEGLEGWADEGRRGSWQGFCFWGKSLQYNQVYITIIQFTKLNTAKVPKQEHTSSLVALVLTEECLLASNPHVDYARVTLIAGWQSHNAVFYVPCVGFIHILWESGSCRISSIHDKPGPLLMAPVG